MNRRLKVFIIGLITVGVLSACAPISQSGEGATNALQRAINEGILVPGENIDPGPLSLNTTLITSDYEFTIKSLDTVIINDKQYLLVDTILTNLSDEDYDFEYTRVSCYADNEKLALTEWDTDLQNSIRDNLVYYSTVIEPGRTERGFFIFEYAREFNEVEVVIDGVSYLISRSEIYGPSVFVTIPAADYYEVVETEETTEETTVETTVETTEETIPLWERPVEEWNVDEGSGLYIEPRTGWLYDEESGMVYFPNTNDLYTIEDALNQINPQPEVIETEAEETEE